MMFKRIIWLTILLLFLSGCGKKTYPAGRLYMPTGNFSYATPDGWFRSKLPGIDFLVVSTNEDYGIQPNIFIEEVLPEILLNDAFNKVSARKKETLSSYQVERQNDFCTQSGLNGIKIEARHINSRNLPLATFQYLIQDTDQVISITCTCADAVKTKYEPVFDKAIQSLQSETGN